MCHGAVVQGCVLLCFVSFSFRPPLLPHLLSWMWPRAWRQQRSSAPAFHHLITCRLHIAVSPLLGARQPTVITRAAEFIFRKSTITHSAIVNYLLTLVLSGSLCRGFLHHSVPSSACLTPCLLSRFVYPPAGPAEPWTVRLLDPGDPKPYTCLSPLLR